MSFPGTDVAFSSFLGFTQSETSTAWCGNNIVVAYNDSGSLFESRVAGASSPLGTSLVGLSRSTNKGTTFTDLGFLNPGPTITDTLAGDPVVVCENPSTFYLVTIFDRVTTSAIAASTSVDGGATWGAPIPAVEKDAADHFVEKPWLAVDPTTPGGLYITYTDFDASNASATCGAAPRTAIELVRSDTGGATWSPPIVIVEVCGGDFVQGSQVSVGPGGEVYVVWEGGTNLFAATREVGSRTSSAGGTTFGAIVKISDVTCVGSCGRFGDPGLLQGAFRNLEYPSLAVDRSTGIRRGTLYVVWNDGRSFTVPDAVCAGCTYGYADILLSQSTDGGATWSAPVQVNNGTDPPGTDQYQPGIAVDKTGRIGVCFYDRRKDPNNFLIERTCATSKDGGARWSRKTLSKRRFAATPAQDLVFNPFYMGDYDTVASDFTQISTGFVGAWGDNSAGNPDILGDKF